MGSPMTQDMKNGDLIQFEQIESVIQLLDEERPDETKKLVATYVISDDKAERISKLMVPQLSFEESVDPQWCVDRRQLRHRQETGVTPGTAPPLHRRSTIPH